MRGTTNIISGVHEMKKAFDNFQNFQIEHPGTKGAYLFSTLNKRIEWCYKQLLTHTLLPQTVRDGVRAEWESDCWTTDAITEKVALLNPAQRESLELLIESLLKGEKIEAVIQ